MPGYLIANIEVHDAELYDRYRLQVPGVIAQYGGRYLVRGGEIEVCEGSLPLKRFLVLEFPTIEAARRFYDSPEYAPLKVLRMAATTSDLVLVEGYGGG